MYVCVCSGEYNCIVFNYAAIAIFILDMKHVKCTVWWTVRSMCIKLHGLHDVMVFCMVFILDMKHVNDILLGTMVNSDYY